MNRPSSKPLIIGHRGAPRHCPENTLPSFEKAIDLGADGIELDVQLTRDGALVVIHDETINRTTEDETGLVNSYTLAQLKRMDFGGWFNRGFAGVCIPTLEEVLELIKSKTGGDMNRLHLDVELKTGLVPYAGIEEKVIGLMHEYDYQNVQLSSFYHQSLITAKAIDPDIPTGVLYMAGLYQPWLYGERLKAQSINPNFNALNPVFFELPSELNADDLVEVRRESTARNLKYYPWTVDTEQFMNLMFAQKVDGIITNRVDAALAIRDEQVAPSGSAS